MSQDNRPVNGVAGLQKVDMKVTGIIVMVYCLCSAGAFGIEEMIPAAGPGMSIILLLVFPIIWGYPICNCVSECGSLLPEEGGIYIWVREAFGEFWAFLANWWGIMALVVVNGTFVVLSANYMSQLMPMSAAADQAVKVGMIAIVTIVNLLGLKGVERFSTALSVVILLAFLLVAVVGIINWQTNPVSPIVPEGYRILDGVGAGIPICIWMYCGYEALSNMAGELKNPQVLPKGLLIALPLIALSYVLPVIGSIASMPKGSWMLWSTEGGFSVGYATTLLNNLGHIWGYIFLVIAIIAQFAILNAYVASGSRSFLVLADDCLAPKCLMKLSRNRRIPYVCILLMAVLAWLFAQFEFGILVMVEVIFMLAIYVIIPLAVIKLRKMYPIEERKEQGLYVMPGKTLGLVYFVGAPVVIAVITMLLSGTDYFFVGVIALATSPIIYMIVKWLFGGLYQVSPKTHPLNRKTRLAFGDLRRLGLMILLSGGFSFLGQFWLRWYEIEYGMWSPEMYTAFGDMIPQIQDWLLWGGLIAAAVGAILLLIGKKVEIEENKLGV